VINVLMLIGSTGRARSNTM